MIYLLSESHMSYHAWPAEKSVTIDFYNCGANSRRNCVNFEEVLCDAFGWENCTCTMTLPRGNEAKLIINDYSHKLDIFKGLNLISRTKS
jgi:S-adenosylmethionine/arginine decarboxylase-like enzyme